MMALLVVWWFRWWNRKFWGRWSRKYPSVTPPQGSWWRLSQDKHWWWWRWWGWCNSISRNNSGCPGGNGSFIPAGGQGHLVMDKGSPVNLFRVVEVDLCLWLSGPMNNGGAGGGGGGNGRLVEVQFIFVMGCNCKYWRRWWWWSFFWLFCSRRRWVWNSNNKI